MASWTAWLPFGQRQFGRVDGHVATRFAHVAFLPLLPLGSVWDGDGDAAPSRAIRLHGGSMTAAYARGWLPLLFAALAWTGRLELQVCAGLVLLLWAWSWRFRQAYSAPAPELARTVLGTRCPPLSWRARDVARTRGELEERWRARRDERTPDDVIATGALDREEAELAYGLFALAGVGYTLQHATAVRRAHAIADALAPRATTAGTPYRASTHVAVDQVEPSSRRGTGTAGAPAVIAAGIAYRAMQGHLPPWLVASLGAVAVLAVAGVVVWRKHGPQIAAALRRRDTLLALFAVASLVAAALTWIAWISPSGLGGHPETVIAYVVAITCWHYRRRSR